MVMSLLDHNAEDVLSHRREPAVELATPART